jgi:tetratricopeptide (TPR) repeat protein
MYAPLAAIVTVTIVALFAAVRVYVLRDAGERRIRRTGSQIAFGAIVVFLGLASLTRARNLDYRTDEALWRDTVAKRPANARARINYGVGLMAAHRYAEAEAQMRAALPLEMDPETRAQVYLQLGSAVAAQRRFDEGIAFLHRALEIDPSIKSADVILGQAYADHGKDGPAARHFLRALERRPDLPSLLQRAGWLFATSRDSAVRDGARAAALAERAIRLTSEQDAAAYETVAAAYAELGRRADAVAAMDRALALARARGDAPTVTLYEQQRAFYAAGGRVAAATR